jgi:hypothetical protein
VGRWSQHQYNTGEIEAELVGTQCSPPHGRVDNVNSPAGPSLHDDEVIERPVSDDGKLNLVETAKVGCVCLNSQAIRSRRRRNRLRGDAIAADTTGFPAFGNARSSSVVIEDHCQAGRAAVQHAELMEHGYTAATQRSQHPTDLLQAPANHRLLLHTASQTATPVMANSDSSSHKHTNMRGQTSRGKTDSALRSR